MAKLSLFHLSYVLQRFAQYSAIAVLATMPLNSIAAINSYSQNFETLNASDPSALANDGWSVAGTVFDQNNQFKFFYGLFFAPNNNAQFSALASGAAGASQGSQYLSVLSDYQCCGPFDGHTNGVDIVESSVLREYVIDASDAGKTFRFSYDASTPNGINYGGSTAGAYMRTIDPSNGFIETNLVYRESTDLGQGAGGWETRFIQLTVDASLVGQLLHVGFNNVSSNYGATEVYYDNIEFAAVPLPGGAWLFVSAIAALAQSSLRRKQAR